MPTPAAGAEPAGGGVDATGAGPPDKSFRCRYVANQVAVKAAHGLSVTQAESEAIARVLGSCAR